MRRAALWLGLAAAFLPTVIPGLHAGHGFPTMPPLAVAQVQHAAYQSVRNDAGHDRTHHHAATGDRSVPDGAPAPAPDRPSNGACPICRTLQQIVVPEIATVISRTAPGDETVEPPVVFVSSAAPPDPTQPRAPPIDA